MEPYKRGDKSVLTGRSTHGVGLRSEAGKKGIGGYGRPGSLNPLLDQKSRTGISKGVIILRNGKGECGGIRKTISVSSSFLPLTCSDLFGNH